MEELILGIDDAGRGPVLGPMVLAGCLITKKIEREFRKLGVKDSKDITQKRREFLEEKIKDQALKFEIEICSASEIDFHNEQGLKLNELEADSMSKIINALNDSNERIKVILDCPSTTIEKWSNYLKTKIKNLSNLEIFCEHKADKNHIAVSAASILAKCERERQINLLKQKYGNEIGSGYPSDPLTIKFLEKNALKIKDPLLFRKSWITWKQFAELSKQKNLF